MANHETSQTEKEMRWCRFQLDKEKQSWTGSDNFIKRV
jgi:hypothetical protein